ncbi:phenazine biosynthesis protein PhzF family [Friedmanniella luteola]|uniref:Phenazine biosynthesis protein PhzF family n=1 Tax=Friedmanniella luteola TaxID=546871 RepID=A0A1H1ZKR9_9ACTN|nr:PhzF family phenazine biosynthesis isomerase [Friedmanniella luteola]SDT34032.1 phenazine biosynthesis protein PhzF family [Friedmanniella luteola]
MDVLRYTAFSQHPAGGNPAGVVLDATGADSEVMQRVAADVGYSETAFLFPVGDDDYVVRYFSPRAEVSFCGHATIAAAVAHAERHGPGTMTLHTRSGRVSVQTTSSTCGMLAATLTSVPTQVAALPAADLEALLAALGWSATDLDPALPPRVAFAGAWHPVIAVRERARLADLVYDFAALRTLMSWRGWTTVDLVWRASPSAFFARNPFPPGGVVEDPATGAAAAALGGYLRALGAVPLPSTIAVFQGEELGRPSQLSVHIPEAAGSGVDVTGHAVELPRLALAGTGLAHLVGRG